MTLVAKNLDTPDEKLEFPNGGANVVKIEDQTVGAGRLAPGWRWSNDVGPIVGAPSCQLPHTGTILAGTLHVEMDDGTAIDLSSGDIYVIPAGHDAWVVGTDEVRTLEWSGTADKYVEPVA